MVGLAWAGAAPSGSSVDGPIAIIGGSALAPVAFEPASGGRLVWQAAALAEEKLLQSDPLAGSGSRDGASAPWLSRIEIAADGKVRFEGRGRPGSRVTLNRHGRPAGSARVSARGDWQLTLDESIGAGEHSFATAGEMPGNGGQVYGSDVRIAIPSDFISSSSRSEGHGRVTSSPPAAEPMESEHAESTRRRAEDLARDASRRFSELQNERSAQAEQSKPPASPPRATSPPTAGSGSPLEQSAQGGPAFWLQDWLARANREFQGEIVRRLQVPGPGDASGGVSVGAASNEANKVKTERERAEAARIEAERVAAARRRAEEERKAAATADARDAEAARQAEAQRKAAAEAQAKAEPARQAELNRQAEQVRQQAEQAQRAKADAEAAARQQAQAKAEAEAAARRRAQAEAAQHQQAEVEAAAKLKAEREATARKVAEAAAAARQKEAQEAAARQKAAADEAQRIKVEAEKEAGAALRTAQDRLAREQRERALLEMEIAERRRRAAVAAERKANEERQRASRKAERGDELEAMTKEAGKVVPVPPVAPAVTPPEPAPRRDVIAKSPRLRGGDGGTDDEQLSGTRITIRKTTAPPGTRSKDIPSRDAVGENAPASRRPAVAGVRMRWAAPACDDAGRTVEPPATYVVARGDSLWRIASRHYRRGHLWRYIYRANQGKIADPDLIYPCQRFHLPLVRSRR